MLNSRSAQSELPLIPRYPAKNSAKSQGNRLSQTYRADRDAILDKFPRSLRELLDQRFEQSYLQAGKNIDRVGGTVIGVGKYALDDLSRANQHFKKAKVHFAFSNKRIRLEARRRATACAEIVINSASKHDAYGACASLAKQKEVVPPIPAGEIKTVNGCINRFTSRKWWVKSFRKSSIRTAEAALRDAGLVSRHTGIYASNDAVNRRIESRRRGREFLKSMAAVNDLGEYFPLDKLVDASVSNPKVRRCELMARLAGLELDCRKSGLIADYYTLTTPSRFHRTHIRGVPNVKFDGSDPRAGQNWLLTYWSRIRAKLKREHIEIHGIRVAEPHHDGTPHWHLLLFCASNDQNQVRAIIRKYMLQDDGDESGAVAKRVKVEAIDYSRGTGVGYLAKYISKNIDGHGIDRDFETCSNVSVKDVAVRVETWASTWGIRQFQFFGAAPVGVWRELRRLRTETVESLEPVRRLVDKGDWAGFTNAIIRVGKRIKSLAVQLWRKWFDRPGEYGDPIGFKTVGVQSDTERILTRERTWELIPAAPLEYCQ